MRGTFGGPRAAPRFGGRRGQTSPSLPPSPDAPPTLKCSTFQRGCAKQPRAEGSGGASGKRGSSTPTRGRPREVSHVVRRFSSAMFRGAWERRRPLGAEMLRGGGTRRSGPRAARTRPARPGGRRRRRRGWRAIGPDSGARLRETRALRRRRRRPPSVRLLPSALLLLSSPSSPCPPRSRVRRPVKCRVGRPSSRPRGQTRLDVGGGDDERRTDEARGVVSAAAACRFGERSEGEREQRASEEEGLALAFPAPPLLGAAAPTDR